MAPVLGLLLSASASAADQPPGVRVVRGGAGAAAASPAAQANPEPRDAALPTLDERPLGPAFDSLFAPPLSSRFAGLGDTNNSIPPNVHGAVGSNYLMETLNTQVRVQNQTGTVAFGPVSLNAFWWAGTGPNPNNSGVTDPRVVYDPFANRWVVVSCDEAGSANSRLLVGVSKTATPDLAFSNWHRAAIDVDPGATLWAKEPTVGFSNQWVVVQVNVYRLSDNLLARSHIYVFDKAQMYAGTLTAYTLLDLDGATYRNTQVPATTYDVGVNDVYLLQMWDSAAGQLRLYKITGPVASPTLVTIGYPTQGAWIDSPGDIDFAGQLQGPPGCQYCVPGPCAPRKIRTNDSRIQNVVYRNGKVWATHTVILPAPTRASVQWWQVRTDATVAQRGLVDDPFGQRFFAFPSIAVNKNDDVLLGYSRFQDDLHAGASYSFRSAIDVPNTMQPESPLKDGEACYYKDFGALPPSNRWGEHSATVVDPADNLRMWTLQEYAAASVGSGRDDDRWGTWWGVVDPTPVIAITDASLPAEGDSGTTVLTFDISLRTFDLLQPQPTSQTVTVNWTTADDTARTDTDADYVPASGTVVFAPGETAKTIQVAVNGDLKKEPTERFFVNVVLQAPGNANLPDAQAVGTIFDDDPDPLISIGDVQVVEGTGGGSTTASFAVTLSNASAMTVTVDYKTTANSAVSPADFSAITTTTLSFAPGQTLKTIGVTIVRDSVEEASESFYVDLVAPVVGGTLQKPRGTGVILDDDAPLPGVGELTVVSDGLDTPLTGRNRLQWVNPATSPTIVRIKWNKSAGTCTYPDPMNENASADFSEDLSCTVTCPSSQPYGGLVLNESYCHTVYLGYAGNTWSQGTKALGRPFDASPGQSVKWKYFVGEGVATLAAPTVGSHGVLVPSNDFHVHAMARGALGGTWPVAPDWTPVNLGSPAQTRSPIVDVGGVPRMYLTTLDGWVHAIDARTGVKMWETQIGTTAWSGGGAAPAGIFTAFGGAWDYILVGTRQASGNRFYALHPDTGAVIDYYPKAGELPVGAVEMGAVTAMASVDYARKQVYFATFAGPTHSLWCLRLGPPSNALQLGWAHQRVDNTPSPGIAGLGDIDGSPVLRLDGTRLYVGNTSGRLWSVDPVDGAILSSFDAAPGGNVNGFPYPDRRNRDVYFVTTASFPGDNIWAVTDDVATGLGLKWKTTASNPSTPLVSTVTDRLYVGSNLVGPGGGVREYALTDGTNTNSVQLTPGPMVIGAPSLDTQALPKSLLHVGSVDGVFYAVEVPF